MRGIAPASQSFTNDQQLEHVVQYWDTPFTAIRDDKASYGMRMDVREPLVNGSWTLPTTMKLGSDASLTAAFLNDAVCLPVIVDGRTANALGYWAAGAPGYHGATRYRRVAYRLRGALKATSEISWFKNAGSIPFQFGVAGSGYVRLRKNGVTFYQGQHTEELFTSEGLVWTTATTFTSTDVLEIFYLQHDDPWGGFVIKAIDSTPGVINTTLTKLQRRQATQEAVVVGCGLFDEGSASAETIPVIATVNVETRYGQTPKMTFTLPLMSSVNDEVGWEHIVDSTDRLGYLRGLYWVGTTLTEISLRRNRVVRCKLGFRNWDLVSSELWPVFTGYIEDFDEVSSGIARVTCSGFEQRLAEQFVKNYPDPISYMSYGFRRKSGTIEPVYPIPAYDNWPLELAMRDLLLRANIDESRMAAPLTVPQESGLPNVPVSM